MTTFKPLHEISWRGRHPGDQHRPTGRHGGPCATLRGNDPILPSVGLDSYSVGLPFEQALNRLRGALSRSGFEILHESDVGWRIRRQSGSDSPSQCRILYVTEPELFATAVSTHASAALWLPIPLVVREGEESVVILLPTEMIVRDRAALLALRVRVQQSYDALAAALKTVATCNAELVPEYG